MAGQPLILIVDDEPDFREIFGAKLGAMGFRIDTAENGQVALEKMAKAKPDLVLMDVRMPVLDGASAVLKMRNDPTMNDVKVVFLTSVGDPRTEMHDINKRFSAEFGAQGYLRKTDNLATLADKIKGFLHEG